MIHLNETNNCIYKGKIYKYFVSWLRDHVHTLKGMKYFCDDNTIEFKRIPVENDVEYLFIEGIYYTWKATGDDLWMNRGLSQSQKEAIIKEYLNINENLPKGSPGEWYTF